MLVQEVGYVAFFVIALPEMVPVHVALPPGTVVISSHGFPLRVEPFIS